MQKTTDSPGQWVQRIAQHGGRTKTPRCAVFGLCALYADCTGQTCDEATMRAALIAAGFEVRGRRGVWGVGWYCDLDEQIPMDLARRQRAANPTT